MSLKTLLFLLFFQHPAIRLGFKCLDRQPMGDTYTLAIMTYAYSLYDSTHPVRQQLMAELNRRKISGIDNKTIFPVSYSIFMIIFSFKQTYFFVVVLLQCPVFIFKHKKKKMLKSSVCIFEGITLW